MINEKENGDLEVDIQYDEEFLEEAKVWYKTTVPEKDREELSDQDLLQAFVINLFEEGIDRMEKEEVVDGDK